MKFKKLLLLLPAVAITSCGYSLSYLVEGNKYNSPIFSENYYQHWDDELKNAPTVKSEDNYLCITKYDEIGILDQRAALIYDDAEKYGAAYKMNLVNDLFNYGVQSKLFDGQVICGGYYQLSRVQVDPNGFSVAFSKESSEVSYLAMQFKTTTDNTMPCKKIGDDEIKRHDDADLFHKSVIKVHTSLYCKNDKNVIEKYTYSSQINCDDTNDGNKYIFYGINLREEHLTRVVGYSLTFDVISDELIEWNNTHGGPQNIPYAMFLYELFIPGTTWH